MQLPPAPVISRISPSLGEADTRTTIYGANFGATQDTVSFGGSSADINSWSNTSIDVLVPLQLTPGTVKVTVTANSQTSNSVDFRVTGSPLLSEEEEEEDDEDEEEDDDEEDSAGSP